jgi:hypothetical protein
MARSAEDRVRREETALGSAEAELLALKEEVEREVARREEAAERGIADLRPLAVGLERDDVDVRVGLLWVPDAA